MAKTVWILYKEKNKNILVERYRRSPQVVDIENKLAIKQLIFLENSYRIKILFFDTTIISINFSFLSTKIFLWIFFCLFINYTQNHYITYLLRMDTYGNVFLLGCFSIRRAKPFYDLLMCYLITHIKLISVSLANKVISFLGEKFVFFFTYLSFRPLKLL